MFFKVKFSLTTDHPPLQRFSYFEWWLCGWGTFGIFIVMVKSDNKLGLNITCIYQLVSSVGSRLFRGLVRILVQLIHLAIEHKVLHETLEFILSCYDLWKAQELKLSGLEISRQCLVVSTQSVLFYLLQNELSLFICLRTTGYVNC